MTAPTPDHRVRQLIALAERFDAHLTLERAMLETIVRHVNRIREALFARDTERLEQSVIQLNVEQQRCAALNRPRQEIRAQMSKLLGIPAAQATISQLARALPSPWPERLEQSRSALVELGKQTQRTNRANASLAWHYAQLAQQMIEALTGRPQDQCYDRLGQLDPNHGPPMFQTKY